MLSIYTLAFNGTLNGKFHNVYTHTRIHTHTQQYFKCPFWVENSIGNTRVGKLIIVFLSIAINVCRYANFTLFYFVQYFLKFTSLSLAFDLLYFTVSTTSFVINMREISLTFSTHALPIRTAWREQTREKALKSAVIFFRFGGCFGKQDLQERERESESASARPA